MTYKFVRRYNNAVVVLVSDYAPDGQEFTRDAMLPEPKGMMGGVFVRQQLLNGNQGEPRIGCDDPEEFVSLAWEFLTFRIPADWLELVALDRELRKAGVKLPEVQTGPKMFSIGWSDKPQARTFQTLHDP